MDEIDHQYTDEIVCPHCGCKHAPIDYEPVEDINEEECSECGKSYKYRASISISWVTYKPEEGGAS